MNICICNNCTTTRTKS